MHIPGNWENGSCECKMGGRGGWWSTRECNFRDSLTVLGDTHRNASEFEICIFYVWELKEEMVCKMFLKS